MVSQRCEAAVLRSSTQEYWNSCQCPIALTIINCAYRLTGSSHLHSFYLQRGDARDASYLHQPHGHFCEVEGHLLHLSADVVAGDESQLISQHLSTEPAARLALERLTSCELKRARVLSILTLRTLHVMHCTLQFHRCNKIH